MKFGFKIIDDRLECIDHPFGYTGNVNTYNCEFDIQADSTLTWYCVFKQEDKAFVQVIEGNHCPIPWEVLKTPAPLYIGCYATDVSSAKRLSTNFVLFRVEQGAYEEADVPKAPTPDLWEILVGKMVPYIGDNGNWYIYDIDAKTYKDSGKSSVGYSDGVGLSPEQINAINDIANIKRDVERINQDAEQIVGEINATIADLPTKPYVDEQIAHAVNDLQGGINLAYTTASKAEKTAEEANEKASQINNKADKISVIDIPNNADLVLVDNTAYRSTEEISNLAIYYPEGDFMCSLTFTTASEGDVTITLHQSRYIGEAPTFQNGETWELSIKNGIVVGGVVK